MSSVVAQLDKTLDTALNEGHGAIMIRVVVLAKNAAASGAHAGAADQTPV
jgi:hypothetical protein